jgi:hypothetical protein
MLVFSSLDISGRLFTDPQTIYVCDSGIQCEAANPVPMSIRSFQNCLPPRDGLAHVAWNLVLRQIQIYSGRTLSYDSDALDAIRNSLDTFMVREEPIFHIWSVPFKCRSPQPDADFDIALNFYHALPCRQRQEFPSWSILGWDGPIRWCGSPFRLTNNDLLLWEGTTDGKTTSMKGNQTRQSRTTIMTSPRYIQLIVWAAPVSLAKTAPLTLAKTKAKKGQQTQRRHMSYWRIPTLGQNTFGRKASHMR